MDKIPNDKKDVLTKYQQIILAPIFTRPILQHKKTKTKTKTKKFNKAPPPPPLPTGNVQPTYTARFSKRGSPNICPGLFKDMWSRGLSLFLANRDEGLLL